MSTMQPQNTSHTSHPNEKYQQLRLTIFVLTAIIVMLIVGGSTYFLGTQNRLPVANIPAPSQIPQISPSPSASPSSKSQPLQPKPTASPQSNPRSGWKTYSDPSYHFTIQYPTNWSLKQEKDIEGSSQIRLTSSTSTMAAFSNRALPELYISIANPYSTSGAVCSNEFCTDTNLPLSIKLKSQTISVPVTKAEVSKDNQKQFDYYAFTFPLPNKKVSVPGYSEPISLNAIASYRTIEEGQMISNILSTLTY